MEFDQFDQWLHHGICGRCIPYAFCERVRLSCQILIGDKRSLFHFVQWISFSESIRHLTPKWESTELCKLGPKQKI